MCIELNKDMSHGLIAKWTVTTHKTGVDASLRLALWNLLNDVLTDSNSNISSPQVQ